MYRIFYNIIVSLIILVTFYWLNRSSHGEGFSYLLLGYFYVLTYTLGITHKLATFFILILGIIFDALTFSTLGISSTLLLLAILLNIILTYAITNSGIIRFIVQLGILIGLILLLKLSGIFIHTIQINNLFYFTLINVMLFVVLYPIILFGGRIFNNDT